MGKMFLMPRIWNYRKTFSSFSSSSTAKRAERSKACLQVSFYRLDEITQRAKFRKIKIELYLKSVQLDVLSYLGTYHQSWLTLSINYFLKGFCPFPLPSNILSNGVNSGSLHRKIHQKILLGKERKHKFSFSKTCWT